MYVQGDAVIRPTEKYRRGFYFASYSTPSVEDFKYPDGFTDSRKSLSSCGKAGGAGSHKKEVACHIKSELELSGVLIDKQNEGKQQQNITRKREKRKRALKAKAEVLKG